MNKTQSILSRFPQFYQTENNKSAIYNIIDSIAQELELVVGHIERSDNMLGIDTTHGEDLWTRWGSLLNIPRLNNELDESYRNRLKMSVTSLLGGTEYSIKYAIAVGLGINNDPIATENNIKIYDAWKYMKDIPGIDKTYGNIVCEIDLNNESYSPSIEDIVISCANNSKASGVKIHTIITNYRIVFYIQLEELPYLQLRSIEYNKLG